MENSRIPQPVRYAYGFLDRTHGTLYDADGCFEHAINALVTSPASTPENMPYIVVKMSDGSTWWICRKDYVRPEIIAADAAQWALDTEIPF